MKDALCLLYTMCPDIANAESLAKNLLAKDLIACVNILPGIKSFYKWEGKVQESQEVLIFLKTNKERVQAAKDYISNQHSYQIPCILELKVESINSSYLEWICNSIKAPESTEALRLDDVPPWD